MVRIQLDLPEEQVASLDQLMADTKLRTRKDLFNNSLALFDWAVKQKKAGRIIAAVDESQELVKEIVMPALENVRVQPVLTEVNTSARSASARGD